ncbi:MAG TPA: peptidase MA family metallohydrolase [Gemmatimonadales bacterium]|nr:peptidase MA family metallohydrolase [Gemmatimonadales bacterium]
MAWPAQAAMAVGLAEIADRPGAWPGLGSRDLGEIRLVITPDSQAFRDFTRGRLPGWGAGAAFPGGRTIVLRADAGDVAGTLRHELAHLALHQAVRGRVPLWFDEGYATMASGQWDLFDRLAINLAVARGSIPGLRALDAELRASQVSADAAYALAATAVMELARRNPAGTLAPLFGRLSAGERFDDAIVATTGLTLDRFDEVWRKSVRTRFGMVTWAVGSGLWIGLAILVGVAYEARRRRDVPRRAALDLGWVIPPEDPSPEAVAVEVPEDGRDADMTSGEGSELDRRGPPG